MSLIVGTFSTAIATTTVTDKDEVNNEGDTISYDYCSIYRAYYMAARR